MEYLVGHKEKKSKQIGTNKEKGHFKYTICDMTHNTKKNAFWLLRIQKSKWIVTPESNFSIRRTRLIT